MAKNYKLGELAKNLKVPSSEVIECLNGVFGEPKKTVSSLSPEETTYVFEYFTRKIRWKASTNILQATM